MSDVSNIRPIGNRILVKLIEPETVTDGGIILPEQHKAKRNKATIVALGNGCMQVNGWWLPWGYKVGDTIMLVNYAGIELGDDHLIVTHDDVVAVVN
ncbi:MAG: co-chaperone GroES [Nitrososphaerales archaeon]|jgi:chaperonin GroES